VNELIILTRRHSEGPHQENDVAYDFFEGKAGRDILDEGKTGDPGDGHIVIENVFPFMISQHVDLLTAF
jgi:hypothetical protein